MPVDVAAEILWLVGHGQARQAREDAVGPGVLPAVCLDEEDGRDDVTVDPEALFGILEFVGVVAGTPPRAGHAGLVDQGADRIACAGGQPVADRL